MRKLKVFFVFLILTSLSAYLIIKYLPEVKTKEALIKTESFQENLRKTLAKNPSWAYTNHQISRSIEFKSYLELMSFLNALAYHSEKVANHPGMSFSYKTLKITYQTHDAENKVTEKDLEAVSYVESLLR